MRIERHAVRDDPAMTRYICMAIAAASLLVSSSERSSPLAGVIVITLDTTRADRLTPYGYSSVAMPALEALAQHGAVFERALAPAPLTLPSHCTIFTGLLPPHHGVRDNGDEPLNASHRTLAEILRAHGFRTAAFVASAVLDASRGLDRGFDVYSGVTKPERQRRGGAVIDEAVAWLDGASSSRFFLWTHLYDAHRPYDAPEPYGSRAPDPYVGELLYADAQIGRLMAALERKHLLEHTLIVVAGDHGESLGEHGERDHGIFVYENVLRVPLIIRAPGSVSRLVRDTAQLIDIVPTILDIAGIPAPPVDGRSLREAMKGHRDDDREAYAESLYPQRFGWSAIRALEYDGLKLIDAPRRELYNLARDPFEQRNIAVERPALVLAMARRLAAIGAQDAAGHQWLTGDVIERRRVLSSLGYSAGAPVLVAPGDARDPKDCRAWVTPPYAECR